MSENNRLAAPCVLVGCKAILSVCPRHRGCVCVGGGGGAHTRGQYEITPTRWVFLMVELTGADCNL